MPRPKRRHRTLVCKIEEIEAKLDSFPPEFDLVAFTAIQVGIGFGAYVNAVLIFRLREDADG
jgi:hypothetical protein